jgi:hypothetical protein
MSVTWTFLDQAGKHRVSEEEILRTYYPWWQEQMRQVGKADQISEASCIEDWVVVHWAWQEPPPMRVFLDELRPAPEGWQLVTSIRQVKAILESRHDVELSLDHDLGACDDPRCANSDWRNAMPHCPHIGTGYDLVCWMEETGHWPETKPVVHSMNPVGRDRMRQVIDRHYDTEGVRMDEDAPR